MPQRAATAGAAALEATASAHITLRRRPALAAALAAALLALAALAALHAPVRERLAAPAGAVAPATPATLASSSAATWAGLSPLARLAVSRGIGADEHAYWPARSGSTLLARNAAQGLRVRFAPGGVTVSGPLGSTGLSLRSLRADGVALRLPAAAPSASANRISYRRGALTEWYANGPLGLEQGFTVARALAPAAHRSLALALSLHTSAGLRARAGAGEIVLRAGRRVALRYGGLYVVDAHGRRLAATLTLRHDVAFLRVATAHAHFPLFIDPTLQGTLTAADGAAGDSLGQSVAVSGSLIAVGAESASAGGQSGAGAVYLFSEPAGGWASATSAAKLTAASPTSGDNFGSAVAISGNTVFAGASSAQTGGAVYFFNKPASGWTSAAPSGTLTDPGGATDGFGYSLAASGSTLVVGAPLSVNLSGAVYVFNEPAGGWASTPPAATLTSTAASGLAAFGWSVALSGSTIVAGAPFASNGAGQVDVFSEPSSGWASGGQTAALNGPAGQGVLGESVGIWGSTIVGGAPGTTVGSNTQQGAVYVFARPSSGKWSDWSSGAAPTATLTASGGGSGDQLGASVTISGTTIIAGATQAAVGSTSQEGSAYVFGGSGSSWTQTGTLTEASGAANDNFGQSLAVSGPTLVVGANQATVNGASSQGSATVFGGIPDSGSPTTGGPGGPGGGPGGGGPGGSGGGSGGAGSRTYATVTSIKGGAGRATVGLACPASTGKCVAANADLIVQEKLSGKRIVATQAKAKFTFRRVVVGSAHVTLLAGKHTNLAVPLNPTGRSLLGAHRAMAVGVNVSSGSHVLRLATATITRAAPTRKPAKKKG